MLGLWDNEDTQNENSRLGSTPHGEKMTDNRKGARNGRQRWQEG